MTGRDPSLPGPGELRHDDVERAVRWAEAHPDRAALAHAWLNGRLARYHEVGPAGRPAWADPDAWTRGWNGEPLPQGNAA